MAIDPQQLAMMQQPEPPPEPAEVITQLLIETAERRDLNIDVQASAIHTLVQAITQLSQEQLPPQAQYELDVQKMKLDNQMKQQEFQLKARLAEQEFQLKQQIAEREVMLKEEVSQVEQARKLAEAKNKQQTNISTKK